MKRRSRVNFILLLILTLMTIPIVVSQGLNITFDNPNIPRVVITPPGIPIISGNLSFNESLGNTLWWRLDGTNDDQISALWDMGGFALLNIGGSTHTGDIAMLDNSSISFRSPLVAEIIIEGDTNFTFNAISASSDMLFNYGGERIHFNELNGDDINLQFGSEGFSQTNVGFMSWMEDEDYFLFDDTINITGFNTGNVLLSQYDLIIGDEYGAIEIGDFELFMPNLSIGNLDLNGTAVLRNEHPANPDIQFLFATSTTDVRLAIPKNADDLAMFNPRSFMVGGNLNATFTNGIVNCTVQGYTNIDCNTELTGADLGVEDDLEVRGFIFVNGSQITDVCLQDGTNCQSSFDFNNTNVAYLNNTQSFTGVNTFSNNISLDGFVGSSDDVINIQGGTNITFREPNLFGVTCLDFLSTIGGGEASICKTNNLNFVIIASQLFLAAAAVTIGNGVSSTIDLDFDTSGTDGTLSFDGSKNQWEISRPLRWLAAGLPVIIPSSIFPQNNVSFDNIFGDDVTFNNMDVFINGELNFTDNINGCTDSQVVMGDGTCVENDTIGQSGGGSENYFSISTNASSNSITPRVFPFASTNYTTYNFIENANTGFSYNQTLGHISPDASKVYRITFDWTGETPDALGELQQIYLDGNLIHESQILNFFNPSGTDEFHGSISIIRQINEGQNLTFALETGSTMAVCPCSSTVFDATVSIDAIT